MITKTHHYMDLNFSPWAMLFSVHCFNLFFSFLLFVKYSSFQMFISNLMVMSVLMFFWWGSFKNEVIFSGLSSENLDSGIKMGMILFISSEVFFFFSFFWSYFHFYLSPTIESAMIWPPILVEMFNFIDVPLVNTLILLSSGVTVTISHFFFSLKNFKLAMVLLSLTFFLGFIFTFFQFLEYSNSFFSISDSTFGTSFFMLTGFHGIHVLAGSAFLAYVFFRFLSDSCSITHLLSFELASWYWHFVDVVWIFLYFFIYYLNN